MYGEGNRKLSERIKISEDDFNIMEPDEYYWSEGNCLSFGESFNEDNIKLNQLKAQILDDHKIVDVLLSTFKKYQSFRDITATSILAEIFKEATGKDIQEIHFMETVQD